MAEKGVKPPKKIWISEGVMVLRGIPVVPIENGSVTKNLTGRDIQILHDLYQYQVLTISQIKELHFGTSEKYVYKRLFQLKREGYVRAKPLVSKGKKVGACYLITEKGVRVLEDQGLSKRERRARDNEPESRRLPAVIERNELYTRLQPYGWTFINGRDFKMENGYNRGSLMKGALVRQDGKEYVLYIAEDNMREQTFKKLCIEINLLRDRNVLVLCKGESIYNALYKETLLAKEVNLLPINFGVRVMQWYLSKDVFDQVLREHGEPREEENRFAFGDQVVEDESTSYYVMDFLMGNKKALYFLTKYSYDVYQRTGKKVLFYYWDVQEFEFPFKTYPHVIPVAMDSSILPECRSIVIKFT
ncbi:DNA-binding PadR family transcriptional regulator [Brevibacillus aydinogluensis]|uniref:replication-relaxation family protein n=1 Tax=Brevibacillus aydinogluensis TaxID=927786 RepID=UPI002892A25F|nr:replication-relaxation family protein [Brevibacillus aydinogluensis]MDT3417156.1 DNA-binding PadR family transcriptional regulator [Brevibacillus aydinogluensis]